MTPKEYLMQYRNIDSEISDIVDEISKWNDRARKITPAYNSGEVHSSNPESLIPLAVEEIDKLRDELAERLVSQIKLRIDIRKTISVLHNRRHRDILERRYIKGQDWETIADAMNYQEMVSIYRIHGKALYKVGQIIDSCF